MTDYLQYGALGLLALVLVGLGWAGKKVVEALVVRIGSGDPQLVAAVNGFKTSVDELRMAVIEIREDNRFMRETISQMTGKLADLWERWKVADAIHELHNQDTAEVLTLAQDIARATVDRPTGVHRLEAIERAVKEREAEREDLLRRSTPPARRRG